MQNLCPISFQRVDENVARINGLITTTVAVVYIATGWKFIPLLLLVDFFIRGFIDPKYSVISILSKRLVSGMGIKPRIINAGPKIFAAQVGSFLSGLAVVALYFGVPALALGSLAMLGFFSFLEGAFAFCVACKIYPFIRKYSPEAFDPGL